MHVEEFVRDGFQLISSHFSAFQFISSHFSLFHLISSHFSAFHLISSRRRVYESKNDLNIIFQRINARGQEHLLFVDTARSGHRNGLPRRMWA